MTILQGRWFLTVTTVVPEYGIFRILPVERPINTSVPWVVRSVRRSMKIEIKCMSRGFGTMSLKSLLGLAAGALIFASVGCTGTGNTVRGQNPASPQAGGVQQAGFLFGSRNNNVCPHCRGGMLNDSGGCGLCGWLWNGRGWHPTHHHTYDYKAPKGLVYPPANQPAAVVQYPYYTLKGPDDFFLE